MSNKTGPGVLARLFRRKATSSFTAELHARAINKPLFVQSDMGAQLINAYLHGPQQPVQAVEGDRTGELTIRTDSGIAVMDISGALTSRRFEAICEATPASYEQMREELAEHYQSDKTQAIVLRLDSPGGEAAQNIDMADFIAANRGKKPVIAMVDDMAYSAAYAIAAACDQIWVTRTAGVGSVGVVSYHVDQSDFNSNLGIKVEYIHAGQRKVDFNPHNPLSEEARDRMQSEVDRLYDMFTESVAQNRGMTVEAVKATEAATYYGDRAIEIGFADKLGTFSDLMAYLQSEDYDAQAIMSRNSATGAQASADLPTENANEGIGGGSQSAEQLEAALQSQQGTAPQASTPTEDLEDSEEGEEAATAENQTQITAEQVEVQILAKTHAEIRAVCTAAGLPDIAQDYITAGTAVDQVRADLVSMIQAGEVEIESTQKVAVEAPTSAASTQVTAASVYARRNQRGN